MKIAESVIKTVESGIEPLVMTFLPVRGCTDDKAVAYRSKITVNSLDLGSLEEDLYSEVSDTSETGIRLAEWGIVKAAEQIHRFHDAEKKFLFVSVHCPAAFAELPDRYKRIKEIFEKAGMKIPKGLCLEFSDKLLSSKSQYTLQAVKEIRLCGIGIIIRSSASMKSPIMRLSEINSDYVILDPQTTALTSDRGKPNLIPSLIGYLRSMGTEVIAQGEPDSEQLRTLGRLGVIGISKSEREMSADQILLLQEESEEWL